MKGSKFARWGKFAVKAVPHIRLGLMAYELYGIGTHIYDSYQDSLKPSSPDNSQSTFRRSLSEDEWWRF